MCCLTWMPSVSCRKRALTETRASSGHSWNQLMAVQLTTAGNFRARTRRMEPTGEKHRITWMCDKANVCGGLSLLRLDVSFWQMAPLEVRCSPGLSVHGLGALLQSPESVAGYLSEPVQFHSSVWCCDVQGSPTPSWMRKGWEMGPALGR